MEGTLNSAQHTVHGLTLSAVIITATVTLALAPVALFSSLFHISIRWVSPGHLQRVFTVSAPGTSEPVGPPVAAWWDRHVFLLPLAAATEPVPLPCPPPIPPGMLQF